MLNLEKLRGKLDRLKNNEDDRGGRDDGIWRAKPGEHVIRVLPWPDLNLEEGNAFKERAFYYNVGRGKILAPDQFGKDDPIRDLRIKCFEEGTSDGREMGKKLFSKTRAYASIIVRGEEAKGVQLLDMNKTFHELMLSFFFKKGLNDIPYTDTSEGFDVAITATEEKMDNGRTWTKLTPDIPRDHERGPAAKNKKQLKEWMDSLPDLEETFPQMSYDQVKARVDEWLGGGRSESSDSSKGTEVNTRSGNNGRATKTVDGVFDELDKLAADEG